jgi:RimJ/RimL family protein N-acetyltransferase
MRRSAPRARDALRSRRLDAPWSEQLVLANGRELIVRPIRPADAAMLRAGFAVLTPDEVRMRFLHPVSELTEDAARRLAEIDRRREFALVAAEPLPPGEALIGAVVRASIDDDASDGVRSADFALIVARPLAGYGLGSHLLRRLLQWCRRKRVALVHGDVLADNDAMLKLVERLGFTRAHVPGEAGIVRVSLDLRRPG